MLCSHSTIPRALVACTEIGAVAPFFPPAKYAIDVLSSSKLLAEPSTTCLLITTPRSGVFPPGSVDSRTAGSRSDSSPIGEPRARHHTSRMFPASMLASEAAAVASGALLNRACADRSSFADKLVTDSTYTPVSSASLVMSVDACRSWHTSARWYMMHSRCAAKSAFGGDSAARSDRHSAASTAAARVAASS